MAKNVAVVGVQWGDEGKGKVVDVLAEHFDIVARYQGGANAGHTVFVGKQKYVLQLLPTGIIRPDKIAAIGNGVVLDPEALQKEIRKLEDAGSTVGNRLKVSDRAHLILPYHRAHEVAAEAARGDGKIGTTAKGIGPTYEDKAGRRGLRACDLRDPALFRQKCIAIVKQRNLIDGALYAAAPLDPEAMADQCLKMGEGVLPYLTDVSVFLNFNGGRSLYGHRRWAYPHQLGHRRFQGVCHPRGKRTFSDGSLRCGSGKNPRTWRRVWRRNRQASTLRLV